MRPFAIHGIRQIILGVLGLCGLAVHGSASAEEIAIIHATAWTMESSEPVRDATILIEDGRIISVKPAGAVPEGVRTLDAMGQPVTPGLMNGATQIGLVEVSGSADTVDTRSTDDRHPGNDVSRALNGNSMLVSLARADGLTRALVYPSPSRHVPFSGEPAIARLRDGVDILDAANVGVFAAIGGSPDRLGSRAVQWAAMRRALSEGRGERDRGKSDDRKSPPARRDGKEMIRAVLAREAPLAIQTDRESDIRQAIALARDFDIHVILVSATEAWRVADQLAEEGIDVILDPQVNLPADFDNLGARQTSAALLTAAGVRVAVGQAGGAIHATYNAGLGLREATGIAVANGLPYYEGLRMVTVNPLAIWGQPGGTLTKGAPADLVIWNGDPLEPSSLALHVIIEGREVSTRSRQDLLAERYKGVR